MSNVKLWFSTAAVMLLIATSWTVPALTQSGAGTGGSGAIQGTVKAADGAPMEGVIVSARASHETFTTSVYTDRQGNYSFPLQSAGQYAMWAQAKGFDVAKADFSLANGGRVGSEPDPAAADRSEGDRAAARWAGMVCRAA